MKAGHFSAKIPGQFSVEINKVIYLGDHIKLIVRLADGQNIVAKVGVEQAGKIGQELVVSWNPDDCIAFAPDRDLRKSMH